MKLALAFAAALAALVPPPARGCEAPGPCELVDVCTTTDCEPPDDAPPRDAAAGDAAAAAPADLCDVPGCAPVKAPCDAPGCEAPDARHAAAPADPQR